MFNFSYYKMFVRINLIYKVDYIYVCIYNLMASLNVLLAN